MAPRSWEVEAGRLASPLGACGTEEPRNQQAWLGGVPRDLTWSGPQGSDLPRSGRQVKNSPSTAMFVAA